MAGRGPNKSLAERADELQGIVTRSEQTISRSQKQIDRLGSLKKLTKEDKERLKGAEVRLKNAQQRYDAAKKELTTTQKLKEAAKEAEIEDAEDTSGSKQKKEASKKELSKIEDVTQKKSRKTLRTDESKAQSIEQRLTKVELWIQRQEGPQQKQDCKEIEAVLADAVEPEPRPDNALQVVDGGEGEFLNEVLGEIASQPPPARASSRAPAELICRSIPQLYSISVLSSVQVVDWLIYATHEVKERLIEVWIMHPMDPTTGALPANPKALRARATLWTYEFKQGNPFPGEKNKVTGQWIRRPRMYRLTSDNCKLTEFEGVRQITPAKPLNITGPFTTA